MAFSESFFAHRFGVSRSDLESYLADALSRGGDYADLYFEYLSTSSMSLDESIVKSATQGVSVGVVDMEAIFQDYPETLKAKNEYYAELTKRRAALSDEESQVTDLRQQLSVLRQTLGDLKDRKSVV